MMQKFSRRDFLKLGTEGILGLCGILGIGGLVQFLKFEPEPPPPQQFDVGSTDLYLLNSRTVIKEIPALLIRTVDSFSALSLTCQHLGCTVESKADGFLCPCHGSRYDSNGKVLLGPAQKGLKSLRVEITPEDKIIIFKS